MSGVWLSGLQSKGSNSSAERVIYEITQPIAQGRLSLNMYCKLHRIESIC